MVVTEAYIFFTSSTLPDMPLLATVFLMLSWDGIDQI
jgi:hypothetical protein